MSSAEPTARNRPRWLLILLLLLAGGLGVVWCQRNQLPPEFDEQKLADPFALLHPLDPEEVLRGPVTNVTTNFSLIDTRRSYDAFGRLTRISSGDERYWTTLTSEADAAGRVTGCTLESHGRLARLEYRWDDQGRLIQITQRITDRGGVPPEPVGLSFEDFTITEQSARLSYAGNQRTMVVTTLQGRPRYTEVGLLDERGRLLDATATIDAGPEAGSRFYTRSYEYDPQGHVTKLSMGERGPADLKIATFTYDEDGRLVRRQGAIHFRSSPIDPGEHADSDVNAVRFEHDSHGNWIRSYIVWHRQSSSDEFELETRAISYSEP